MRIPVVLVTGVDPEALASTMVGLQFDLPTAVAVQHHIDVGRSTLRRVVSDLDGVVEVEEIDLEHACVSCALRQDVLPTLERLAASGRWRSIVAHLLVGAEARQVCHVLAHDTVLARRLRVAAVVAAAGASVEADLLGDDLLAERGLHSSDDDRRGVGEVEAAQVEHADLVVVHGDAGPAGTELLQALARPGVEVAAGVAEVDGTTLTRGLHQHDRTLDWVAPVRRTPLPRARFERVWRLDLVSGLPFHPDRLLADLAAVGGGPHRSRGCFWLPTRPGRVCTWDGCGGQLSIGDTEAWGRRTPQTRVVVVGLGDPPYALADAFRSMLLRPDELRLSWSTPVDGLEPWLGPLPERAG